MEDRKIHRHILQQCFQCLLKFYYQTKKLFWANFRPRVTYRQIQDMQFVPYFSPDENFQPIFTQFEMGDRNGGCGSGLESVMSFNLL